MGESGGALVLANTSRAVTRGERWRLSLAAFVFMVGGLAQLLAIVWFALGAALAAGATELLLRTGGLERTTFATCSLVAIVIDAIALLAIAMRSARRSLHVDPDEDRFSRRHPLLAFGIVLFAALVIATVCALVPNPFFPFPLATIAILANLYYFALLGVFGTARLATATWRVLRDWSFTTSYRTGALTASLLLLGAAGGWLFTTRWFDAPLHRGLLGDETRALEHADGVFAGELDGLCVLAAGIEPTLADDDRAPACSDLGTPTTERDRCFSMLNADKVPELTTLFRSRRLSDDDLHDALMKAMIATCTREPPPDSYEKYFFDVASRTCSAVSRDARRTIVCEEAHPEEAACPPASRYGLSDAELARVWESAMCQLEPLDRDIIRRRLVEGERYREVGQHVGLTEAQTKNRFNNAIKKLRARGVASCALP